MYVGMFRLNRVEDETGVSGSGIVAYGAFFPNGKAVLAWCVPDKPQSVAVYDSLQALFDVHVGPHKGKTRMEWGTFQDAGEMGWVDFTLDGLTHVDGAVGGET